MTIKTFFLRKIRLSQYFIILLLLCSTAVFLLPDITFTSGALTLFSVNSFLYGFYIAPILSGQKSRIDELHKIVRSEANAIFSMVIHIKKLPKNLRNEIQDMFIDYLKTVTRERKSAGGEVKYEALITYCLNYKGPHQEEIDTLLDQLVANQQNRTNFTLQMRNRVYSNEWMIMLVLFSITMSFVMLLNPGSGNIYQLLAGLLATGLSMLLVILLKMSTLSHKKARQIWDPYKKLVSSHFYRID